MKETSEKVAYRPPITVDRFEGEPWPIIAELAGRCRSEADLRELRVRAHELAVLAERGDVHVVRGRTPQDAARKTDFAAQQRPGEAGRLLAIGGPVRFGAKVCELWGVVAEDLRFAEGFALARFLVGWAKLYLQVHKLQRIQATVRTRDAKAVKLLEVIGMRREGVMRRYGVAGEHHAMYAMTDLDHLVLSPGGPRRGVLPRLASSLGSPEEPGGERLPARRRASLPKDPTPQDAARQTDFAVSSPGGGGAPPQAEGEPDGH